ncbi:hypothetical protein CQW23_00747 [Capsicum baccatum]|uniref:ATP-dependent DNA helicase n=1 Tax=Capsicum baccatum TaxID=33114 RepID=A0A2G2XLK9_CAPBA|nr:hypothetical protein CQW23_00747 [Capsicum baccatum]
MGRDINEFKLISEKIKASTIDKEAQDVHFQRNISVSDEDLLLKNKFNNEQRTTYNIILERVFSNKPGAFFIDGPGGTGKSFLYRALGATVRHRGFIALATASSGVAASLLPDWAFEVIPYLRKQVNYQERVSCPRILRWLLVKTHKNAKFLDLFNPPEGCKCASVASSDQSRVEDAIFSYFTVYANLSNPKVIDRIKMELFGATTITRKTILEGGLVVVDGAVGGGSGAAVGANDAPLTVFKANHYEYDHTGYTDFASLSECFPYNCQDCKAKHDVVINSINALTASVKELTSKRGLIP